MQSVCFLEDMRKTELLIVHSIGPFIRNEVNMQVKNGSVGFIQSEDVH